jgi:hypothetical protein
MSEKQTKENQVDNDSDGGENEKQYRGYISNRK